jgi:hypothetical protein
MKLFFLINFLVQIDTEKLMRIPQTVFIQQDQSWKLSDGRLFIDDVNGVRKFNPDHRISKIFVDCVNPNPNINDRFITLRFELDEDPIFGDGHRLIIFEKL